MAEKNVTLYTCPTGGWVLNNRVAMERHIKEKLGEDCVVSHGVSYPFCAQVAVNGVKGKMLVGPFLLFCPCGLAESIFPASCVDADHAAREAQEIYESLSAEERAPVAVTMRQ